MDIVREGANELTIAEIALVSLFGPLQHLCNAIANVAPVALNTAEALPHPAIPANAAIQSLARTGGPIPREGGSAAVLHGVLWDARERGGVRGQDNVGIYSRSQRVTHIG